MSWDFSDTQLQWELFREYGRARRVCEIGVHFGGSTRTFLQAPCASLVSIEKYPVGGVEEELRGIAKAVGVPWTFVEGDSLAVGPIPCEVLFIDSLHTKEQLLAELTLYAPEVSDMILVHDTGYWGMTGEGGGPGLIEAVLEFVGRGDWEVDTVHEIFPGLTVLKRASDAS
jgi:cephalosporin hydroxylase